MYLIYWIELVTMGFVYVEFIFSTGISYRGVARFTGDYACCFWCHGASCPANTRRDKHVIITWKRHFGVIITCLLRFVYAGCIPYISPLFVDMIFKRQLVSRFDKVASCFLYLCPFTHIWLYISFYMQIVFVYLDMKMPYLIYFALFPRLNEFYFKSTPFHTNAVGLSALTCTCLTQAYIKRTCYWFYDMDLRIFSNIPWYLIAPAIITDNCLCRDFQIAEFNLALKTCFLISNVIAFMLHASTRSYSKD